MGGVVTEIQSKGQGHLKRGLYDWSWFCDIKQLWPEAEGSIENYVPSRQIDPEAQLRDLSVWMGHNFQWIPRPRAIIV